MGFGHAAIAGSKACGGGIAALREADPRSLFDTGNATRMA